MFSEWIRRSGFWAVDFIKGSPVRKHLNDIRSIMENPTSSEAEYTMNKYLREVLIYAQRNIPFYQNVTEHELASFPIIDKNIIKQKYDAFLAPKYLNEIVYELHTSGSTGTPFVVRQDKNKRHRVFAEMMYFWDKAGFQIGKKYVFFRIWTDVNRKAKLEAWARNLMMHDILRLDRESLEQIRMILHNDKRIKMLLSYASTFDNLAKYLDECGDSPADFSVETIISSSEVLQDTTRDKLKSIFGCDVVSFYSNQENGTLAQECIENTEFHLNTASYHFEFLRLDEDVPANLGEPARIVVTDLFNRAMPLIRYDTGDIASLTNECACGWKTHAVKDVLGRRMDCIYDTRGRVISPVTITNYMWPFDKLLQFQFIQLDKTSYTLRLNGARGVYKNEEFIALFKELLGLDANISIEHVHEIPVLDSGKQKHVICKF